MIAAAQPLHVATVCGKPFRFFRGPRDAPDMPWHAHDDLLAALALPRPLRRELRAKMLKNFGPQCRTVEVDGEPVLIALAIRFMADEQSGWPAPPAADAQPFSSRPTPPRPCCACNLSTREHRPMLTTSETRAPGAREKAKSLNPQHDLLLSEHALKPAERRRLKGDSRATGYAAQPGTGPAGEASSSCEHLVRKHLAKVYRKCGLIRADWTGGKGTNVLTTTPACRRWQAIEKPHAEPTPKVDIAHRLDAVEHNGMPVREAR